jgi:hypothetical protein
MSLTDIVQVTIQPLARGITRAGFGVPLVVGYHTAYADRYREYTAATALADLVTDGIPATSQIYKAVRSVVSQNPRVSKVAVGRLTTAYQYDGTLEVIQANPIVGDVYSFTLRSPGGTTTAISYTVQAGDTPTLVAAALNALITAVADITSTSALGVITFDADNTGETFQFEGLDVQQLAYTDTTIDSSLATEIGEIDVLYPDWYGIVLADCPSKARNLAVAGYVETKEKIFGALSHDYENVNTGTSTSCCYALNAADYERTYCIVSNDQNSHLAGGWMGDRFPIDAGSSTWKFKDVSGTTVDTWTAAQETVVKTSKGNTYTTIAGLPTTAEGTMASGTFIDIVRGRDWLIAQLREEVFSLLRNAPKVPFTDAGVSMVIAAVKSVMARGIARGYLNSGQDADGNSFDPIVTAPLVADVSTSDKADRILPDVYFEAYLAGAIHSVKIYGVLQV